LDLLVGEDRPVDAHVRHTDAAMAALADSTFHITLQRGNDVPLCKSHCEQVLDHKSEHHWRTTDKRDGVLNRNLDAGLLEQAAYDTDMPAPLFVSPIDRDMALNAGRHRPFIEVGRVHQLAGHLGPMENLYAPVLLPVFHGVYDRGPQWDQADSSGNKDQVFPFVILHGKSIAVWPAYSKFVAWFQLVQRGRTAAHFPHREEGFVLCRAGRQRGGKL